MLIPAGRYLVRQRVLITSDNIVLKGAGPNDTVLYFNEPLEAMDNRSKFLQIRDDMNS